MRFEPDKLLENRLVKQNQELKVEKQKQDYYYRELLDNISCGVLSYTLPDRQIVHMNAEAMRIYGVSSISETQENLADIFRNISYSSQAVDLFLHSEQNSFDVILMDVMMPVMDGLTAARTIRGSGKNDAQTIPIFAMTAHAFQEDMQRSREAGMWEHLSKPLNEQEIYRTIGKYV